MTPSTDGEGQDAYDTLRDLIVGPEQRELVGIKRRLDDPVQRAEEISHVLPDAILLGDARDNRIVKALEPAMDRALKVSVRNNPKALVDAIYPILGPGIRKAVSSILMGMIQSLNRMLDMAFSIRGIKWRLEAIRSRRPFAEIVLLHTLVYQVEQMFLIHRDTGLVLQHVSSPDIASRDPDLVSGMLSAIQNFITDSFPTETSTSLETLRMGDDLSVMIEQSRHAIMAAVIRGTPPMEQREKYRRMLEEIELRFDSALEAFQGDTAPFIVLKNRLEEGIDYQLREESKRTSPLLWILSVLVLSILGYWGYHSFRTVRAWDEFVQDLKGQPGVVVTDYGKENGRYYLAGLKDPLAGTPEGNEEKYAINASDVSMRWVAYESLDPDFILMRCKKSLSPPETVHLSFSDGCLTAVGSATHDWITLFRQKAIAVTGVEETNVRGVVDEDMAVLGDAVKRLSAITIDFPKESSRPLAGQQEVLVGLAREVEEIQKLSRGMAIDVEIVIIGHTDPTGTETFNRHLSKDRADSILAFLVAQGVAPSNITTLGVTSDITADSNDMPMDDTVTKRVVMLKAIYHIPEMETEKQ